MDTSQLKWFDLKRLFFGDAPPEFLIEVLIRTIIIFLFLVLAIRLLGKRMGAQISRTELCVIITLGAIVSPVMQLADRGILFGVTVLATICALHWLMTWWSGKNEKVELTLQGKLKCLVKDGVMQVDNLHRAGISHEELFAQLRKNNVETLAEVKRVYLEGCGLFSVYKNERPGPGLLVFPEEDNVRINHLQEKGDGIHACSECGHVQYVSRSNSRCEICHSSKWARAYESRAAV